MEHVPNPQDQYKEAYEKLLQKRGLERHREVREVAQKRAGYQERMAKLKELNEKVSKLRKITAETEESKEVGFEAGQVLEKDVDEYFASLNLTKAIKSASWKKIRFFYEKKK